MGKRSLECAKTEREYAQAVEWIRLAADQGNAKAETGLGLLTPGAWLAAGLL